MNALAPILLPLSLLFIAPTGDRDGWFAKKDADNSGTISAAEAEGTRLADHFAKIDANKDGELTKAELQAGRKGRKDGKKGKHSGMAERLTKLDDNGDGAWSKTEVADTPLAKYFDKIDADNSGTITKAELKAAFKHRTGKRRGHLKKKLSRLDTNRDGAWTKAEVAGTPLAKYFDKIDSNSDGKITKAELQSMHAQRKGGRRDGKPRPMKHMGKGKNPNARKQG